MLGITMWVSWALCLPFLGELVICDVLIREARDAEMAAMLSQKLNVDEMEALRQQEEKDMVYARNLMVSVFVSVIKKMVSVFEISSLLIFDRYLKIM